MTYQYIKNIMWPWVEVRDGFSGNGTVVINMDEVSIIDDDPNSHYDQYGIRLKDGSWYKNISAGGLTELKTLVTD